MGSIIRVPTEDGEEFWYVPHSAPITSTATGPKLRISKDAKAVGMRYHDKAMLAGAEAIALGVIPADGVVKVRGAETEVSFHVDAHDAIQGLSFDPPVGDPAVATWPLLAALDLFDIAPKCQEWWIAERPATQRDADGVAGLRVNLAGLPGFDEFLAHCGAPEPSVGAVAGFVRGLLGSEETYPPAWLASLEGM